MQEFLPAGNFTVKQHKALSHLGKSPIISYKIKSNKKVELQGEEGYNKTRKRCPCEQKERGSRLDIISPKMDFCAKELFANQTIRKYFISDVTGIRVEDIKSVRLCNPFLRLRRNQKEGILDCC